MKMDQDKNEFYLSILERDTAQLFENFIKDFSTYNKNSDLQTTLAKCLLQKPFPSIQLLDGATDNLDFKTHIKRLALQIFLELNRQGSIPNAASDDDTMLKFINFLVNLEQPAAILEQKSANINEMGEIIGDFFYMGLLANSNLDFLLYPAFPKKSIDYFSKDVILCEALKHEAHFVTLAIQKQKNFVDLNADACMRNAFILAKVANEFNSLNQSIDEVGNLKKMLELYDSQKASEIQNIFYNDFRRLGSNIDFLRKYTPSIIPIGTLIETNGILPLIFDHKNILLIGYDEIRQVIELNHTFESQTRVLASMKEPELETLTYFFVLASVYDVIINRTKASQSFYDFAQEKISRLKVIIRQIRNIDVLCNLMEDIFQLVFLRWEHLDSPTTASRQFEKKKSTSSTDAMETRAEGVLLGPVGRHGFICQGAALKFIFSFLKHFITQKLHSEEYKICSERIKLRFTRVMDCINDGLWKFSVLEKISDTEVESFQMEPEDLLQLVQLHTQNIDKTSSEDESKERINYASLSRRKAKKRRRATFGGGEHQRIGVSIPPRKDIKSNGAGAALVTDIATRKSIIPNMLTTPENLAVMALAMKNFNDVKYIIQTFNLQNTELNRELQFVENQQHTKRKLETIYENYLQQEIHTIDPQATVEQIKKAAAKGFEASKIISIVDNFANANTFECSDEIQTLLEKYSHNYPFLQHYQGRNVRAVIAADLILNLNINYDIMANVVPVIRRMCKLPKISSSLSINSGLPSEMGCLNFLENLCECMRLLKSHNLSEDIGLKDLLCNSFFSLKPKKLSMELNRERIFQNVFSKIESDVQRLDDLKLLTNDFADLKAKCNYFVRFLSYIGHLSKFLQIRDKQAEFSTSSLLRFDTNDIIGELIFEENMTPLEIESHVVALNLNLIHVIALNICPEICGKERKQARHSKITKEKYQSIFNYITNQNALLGYVLQKIQDCSQTLCSMMNDEYLQRLIEFESVICLSKIYNGNCVVAGILSQNIDKPRMKMLSIKNIEIYDILQNCQEGVRRNRELHLREKDKVIVDLIAEDTKYVYLASDIEDINTRAALIFRHFTKVPSSCLAKDLIESTLLHTNAKNIDKELRINLERTLSDISIYSEVSLVLDFESWPQAYDFGLKTPNAILQKLLSQGHYKLCYDWCCVVQLSVSFDHQIKLFFATFLEVLVQLEDDFDRYIVQTIETFPQLEVCQFYDANKHKFRSVHLLNYVIDFLSNNIKNTTSLRNYKVSLKIFEQLTPTERDQNWNLLSKPLLIVEQLIMNVKFKELASILDAIRPFLEDNQSNCLTVGGLCKYCFDKRGNIYDIHSKNSTNFTLGNESSSAFILLNFNLYQKDHIITLECVDLLMRIYATKALDYQIREMTASSSERVSQSTDMASLDSLCGAFVMPQNAPTRDYWVQDDEATHCMCCRRAVFTMLMRRHHCRRCGRVVCFACSTNRMQIPELYEDVAVRVCNDCLKQTQEQDAKSSRSPNRAALAEKKYKFSSNCDTDARWKLSGNITHDKLLREEFCYEHAPSVALCLSILSYHSDNRKCVDLLLFHCGKLEKLLVPNPEVDYELIAKMMNCLALAAKVRGGPPEVETIREHSDIIMSVVQNGCEALIPAGPLNNQNLRKLADSLVQVEKWQLALEIHWKCGFPTAGVMAAHGLACLRAGSFETAKEKLSHCMTKHCSEQENANIIKIIFREAEFVDLNKKIDIPTVKRPYRSPPLLQEILKIIEPFLCSKLQPETLARASIIQNSNTSLASLISKRREHIPLHEPAMNILNTLLNLKQLSKGQYSDNNALSAIDNKRHVLRHSRFFEECLHYVITYGSHSDIVDFFIRHNELSTALKYYIIQGQDVDLFIHHIFLGFLRTGSVNELIHAMTDIDQHLGIWKEALLGTCRYLETKGLYNCLYELQIILNDPIRASMTCVKFYSMNCQNFKQLHANSLHLQNAHRHLQSELEMSQWERINERKQNQTKFNSILMQMDAKSLNAHINTLLRQMDVAKFLAQCEDEQRAENGMLVTEQILKQIRMDSQTLPTLFNSAQDKIQICILILLSGKNIEEGFGLAYRIIQNYKLPMMKVFGATAKYLARNGRLEETEKLLNCIIGNNGTTNREIDEILSIAINSATNNHQPEVKTALDNLAKKITSLELRISSYIFIGQLKAAYLLAIQHNRLNDIKKILHQAEATNQVHIKKLCEKKLSMSKQPEV